MGRPTLLPALALLLLFAGTALADGARFEGAGAEIDELPGTTIHEGWTGSLYQLDVRRDAPGPAEGIPFLRMVVAPRPVADPTDFADHVLGATLEELAKGGRREILRRGTTGSIDGENVEGRQVLLGPDKEPDLAIVSYGVANGSQRVVVLAKIDMAREAEDLKVLRLFLRGLTLRKIGADSVRQVRVGGVRFRVPLTAREKWEQRDDGSAVGRFTLPECLLTVHLRDAGSADRADRLVAESHSQNHESVKLQTANSGVDLIAETMTAIPAGDDLLIGSVHRIRIAGKKVRDSVMVPLQDGARLLGFSFLCDLEYREAMSARMAQVLGSVVRTAPRHRPPNLFAGGGILLRHGSRDELTWKGPSKGSHLTLHLELPGPLPGPAIRLFTRQGPPVETAAEFHARTLVSRSAPAEGRDTSVHPVTVLGAECELRVTRWPTSDGKRFLATLRTSFQGRELGLTVYGEEAARADVTRAVRFLLSRLQPTDTETEIDAGPFTVTVEMTPGTLVTADGLILNRALEVRGPGPRAQFRRIRVHGEIGAEELGAEVDRSLRRFRATEEGRELMGFEEIERAPQKVGDHPAEAARFSFTAPGGRTGFVDVLAVRVQGGMVSAHVVWSDDSLAAAAARLIGSLRLPD